MDQSPVHDSDPIIANTSDIARQAFPCGRVTGQRRAIAATVSAFDGAFTIEDLATRIHLTDPSAGSTATLYRAVAAMEASGFVTRVGTREGSALFVHCDAGGHHHHVVCDGCGRVEVAECPLPAEALTAGGFRVTHHEVTLYGLCPACAARLQER